MQASTADVPAKAARQRRRGRMARTWRGIAVTLRAMGWSGKVGLFILAVMVIMAVFAPWLAPYDPHHQDLMATLQGPSTQHWLGTDNLGRDLVSRLVYGARIPLAVGLIAAFGSMVIGVSLGLLAGIRGGLTDAVIMRVTDAFICFPPLILILSIAATLGAGIHNIVLSFLIFGWTGFARIVRAEVLVKRELPYVEAARSIGMSEWRVALVHVLPNCVAPIVVAFSITMGSAILVEGGASFLGLGAQPPTASWGRELQVGFTYIESVPLVAIASGLMISLAVIAFNFIGDALLDVLDPRRSGAGRRARKGAGHGSAGTDNAILG